MSSSALMVASHADTPALPVWGLLRRTGRHMERVGRKRQRGDSNPCGQSPMDFESISLTARTHCHVRRAFSGAACLRCWESCTKPCRRNYDCGILRCAPVALNPCFASWLCKVWPSWDLSPVLGPPSAVLVVYASLYSSVVERQSCKLKVLGSIPSGGSCVLVSTMLSAAFGDFGSNHLRRPQRSLMVACFGS